MVKEYEFIKTSTAGNRTGFFLGDKALQNRNIIIKTMISKINLEAEQYGFLRGGDRGCYLTMAGDELCGGAILASPAVLGEFNGQVDIMTVGSTVKTMITNKGVNKLYVESEIEKRFILDNFSEVTLEALGGIKGYRVNLNEITYFVTEEKFGVALDNEAFYRIDEELSSQLVPCLGIIRIVNSSEIIPTIWVKKVGTITAERGCTTGTIASQIVFPRTNGTWIQPSGEFIKVKISDNICIEAGVEILSRGIVYVD